VVYDLNPCGSLHAPTLVEIFVPIPRWLKHDLVFCRLGFLSY
jgi:hypothetical protein